LQNHYEAKTLKLNILIKRGGGTGPVKPGNRLINTVLIPSE